MEDNRSLCVPIWIGERSSRNSNKPSAFIVSTTGSSEDTSLPTRVIRRVSDVTMFGVGFLYNVSA